MAMITVLDKALSSISFALDSITYIYTYDTSTSNCSRIAIRAFRASHMREMRYISLVRVRCIVVRQSLVKGAFA